MRLNLPRSLLQPVSLGCIVWAIDRSLNRRFPQHLRQQLSSESPKGAKYYVQSTEFCRNAKLALLVATRAQAPSPPPQLPYCLLPPAARLCLASWRGDPPPGTMISACRPVEQQPMAPCRACPPLCHARAHARACAQSRTQLGPSHTEASRNPPGPSPAAPLPHVLQLIKEAAILPGPGRSLQRQVRGRAGSRAQSGKGGLQRATLH